MPDSKKAIIDKTLDELSTQYSEIDKELISKSRESLEILFENLNKDQLEEFLEQADQGVFELPPIKLNPQQAVNH